MIEFSTLGPHEEIFNHIDDVDGKRTTFAVTRFRTYCEAHEGVWTIPITKENAEFCRRNRGIEPHRLARLRPEDLQKPLLFVLWPNGEHLMIDGTHRYVQLADLDIAQGNAWVVDDREVWEQFTVANVPNYSEEQLLRSNSGM